jgi:hypothetical protein
METTSILGFEREARSEWLRRNDQEALDPDLTGELPTTTASS